jgi:hypothetical protein
VWGLLAAVGGLGVLLHFAWQRTSPLIAAKPHYRITADGIHVTPPPPWIRSDIKMQVLRDAGLADGISVLDDWDTLARRVKDAFEFHPWVASVERITKRLPPALEVELTYRRPIAAVESRDSSGVTFLPIDERGVRLPESDLTDVERRYLPRISGVAGRPLVGDVWNDARVRSGAKLIAALESDWQELKLVEIMAALRPQSSAASYIFEIITTGGTRIIWGAAPGEESSAGEPPFDRKRQRLREYAAQHGKLESIDGPASIDVRSDLVVTPRTARQKQAATTK